MLVSYVIVTYRRDDALRQCLNSICTQDYRPLEIVVVDNAGDSRVEMPPESDTSQITLRVLRPGKNLGAAGGRNWGMQAAKGDYYLLIDDDAVIIDPHSTQRVIDLFRSNSRCGVVSFRSLDPDRQVIPMEFPHPDKRLIRRKDVFEVPYFYAMGHAFRPEVIKATGGYSEFLFYLMEEYELALRVLDKGYIILYDPGVCVIHNRGESRRHAQGDEWWYKMALNKARSAFLNLPMPYPWTVTLIWGMRLWVMCNFRLKPVVRMFRTLISDRATLRGAREPISGQTTRYLQSIGGRLLY